MEPSKENQPYSIFFHQPPNKNWREGTKSSKRSPLMDPSEAPGLAKYVCPVRNICPSSHPGSARPGFWDSPILTEGTLICLCSIEWKTTWVKLTPGGKFGQFHCSSWEPSCTWGFVRPEGAQVVVLCGSLVGSDQGTPVPISYPKVSIQCTVLQRISSPEVLVTPLCLLRLSSSTFECTQAYAWCQCSGSGHVGDMKEVRMGKLGITWKQKNSKRQFTKLNKMQTDTHKLHNATKVALLM